MRYAPPRIHNAFLSRRLVLKGQMTIQAALLSVRLARDMWEKNSSRSFGEGAGGSEAGWLRDGNHRSRNANTGYSMRAAIVIPIRIAPPRNVLVQPYQLKKS